MTPEEVTAVLEQTGALLKGHFLLSSGLHSDRYVQCALALSQTGVAMFLGGALARRCATGHVDLVAGPALGGIVIAHETARGLGVPCIFAERADGVMTFRRGFRVEPGQRVVIVEDVITTGKSVREVAALVLAAGAEVAGFGCIADRSRGGAALPAPMAALVALDFQAYEPAACPLCRAGGPPPVKPGSRPGAGS